MRRVHVVVRGKVQGVGYRYTTGVFARRFGAAGWIRNLADGSVEAEIEGTTSAVDRMLAWMSHGPPGARVDALETRDMTASAQLGFEIRETV
ncbi:acylphosphatase [Microbacterium sp. P07]|uniref:acylphosphatase n=1 Tax=Microbacterium sp. P07 TaxID=3366952 RepID=UPI0037473CCC